MVGKREIRAQAKAEGFAQVGFAAPQIPAQNQRRMLEFIDQGHHGTMAWMEGRGDERADPKALWREVRTVISLGFSYGPGVDVQARVGDPALANISAYAWGRDYHDLVKKAAKRLGRWLIDQGKGTGKDTGVQTGKDTEIKVFVDTAPVMEKPLAQQAGIGWQGKHTNLVSGQDGSWLFLAEIYTNLDLAPDSPGTDQCGSCTRCLDVCPTKAMPTPYTLDATKCLAYLSIEHEGPIPIKYRKAMGNRIYGCDDCLAVCPWNKFAAAAREARLHKSEVRDLTIREALAMGEADFRVFFSGSPIKRLKWHRWMRNALICAGNSGDVGLLPLIEAHQSSNDETLAEAAKWSGAQLSAAPKYN